MSAPLLMLDHDGVIVDSLEIFSSSFLLGCRREGLAAIATQDDLLRLFAGNVYESMRAAGADDGQIRRVVQGAANTMCVAMPALHPFPLMPEVLGELGEARHVVVVTSNTEAVVSTFLRRHGIGGVAEIAGAEAGQSKVDKIRGLTARFPEQDVYWFVGDTAGDMREARLAGATPVGVAWGWHEPDELEMAGAERIAQAPADLLAIVAPELSADFLGSG
jgi:phosphoglycolate phosphatase